MKKLLLILLVFAFTNAFTQSQYGISGKITYDNTSNSAIEYSEVILKDKPNHVYAYTYTDTLGIYAFSNIPNGNYTIDIKPNYKWGGVSPVDALSILRYFVKLSTFKDALKKKAADVNGDKNIIPMDALLINRRFVKLINSFTAGEWVWNNNTVAVNGQNIILNIQILCTGDVDGSYIPSYRFSCGDSLVDLRDGQVYKTVKIGGQCWFKENLNATKYSNGDLIPNVTDNTTWSNLTTGAYCYYNNDSATYANTYGRLFNWYAVNDSRKLCPKGWHVSTNAEWTTLITFLGGEGIAGGKMKETDTTHWLFPNTGATNSSGFTALPGGGRYDDFGAIFGDLYVAGSWWSDTEAERDTAYALNYNIYFNDPGAILSDSFKINGSSVRCVKDCPAINSPGLGTNTPSQNQIIWKWQAVTGATGYKWSTTNNYFTATDIGTSTSYTQTGLTCNTSYTLYVWAYNSCSNFSSATTLTQSTSACPCPAINAPGLGTNTPSQNQIIWKWQAVTGATGYKWSTTNNYSTATDNGISTSYTQTGLTCNTSNTLYVWAYNSCSNFSSATALLQNTSTCSIANCGIITDSRDGKTYKTVIIGTQCWMAQNLNVGTRINGVNNQTNNGIIEKYCYNDDENNCNIYGGLYQWDEMMQYVITESTRGICPTGFHVPSHNEWTTLERAVCSSSTCTNDFPYNNTTTSLWLGTDEGGKLKEAGTIHWVSPNTGANNSSGFSALPGGDRHYNDGKFGSQGISAHFWCSTEYDLINSLSWRRYLSNSYESIYRCYSQNSFGFSVRCVKDN